MKTFCKILTLVLGLSGSVQLNAQVPLLSSHPSATAVIFLDFDGHTVTGTTWNFNGPIYCAPSGLDAAKITSVYNRVAEDFRPFNVNVTTDSTKFLAAPINKRMRVVETVSYEWYGAAGGVAFMGSFTWGDDSPCFVFTSLLNYNAKNISEASSHEVGHTLNLQHQSSYNSSCVKTSEYHTGTGSGEIGWAPIMGVGYYQNLTLWNNGKSTLHCDSIQNDLSVITTGNGFGYRTDDHANTFPSATEVPFVNNEFETNGIITQSGDQDMIRLTVPMSGRFQLNAVPYNVGSENAGSNLDLQVTLFNGSETQLNVYNPGTKLSSVIDTLLAPGTYYLRVEGKGNVFAPNYASLGSYSLTGTLSFSTLPLKKLELTGVASAHQHRLNWAIESDEAVARLVLEQSTDGRNFLPLVQTALNERTYTYTPGQKGSVQYRLNVTFDNGRKNYSNIVVLKNETAVDWPKLSGNTTGNSLTVNSGGIYKYSLFEMTGRLVSTGALTAGMNQVQTGNLISGIYLIRYTNGSEHLTEKFIRQ